jgi:uncharacterized protein (TIGR02646 family)
MIRVLQGLPPAGFHTRARMWKQRFAESRMQEAELSASVFWSRVRPELAGDAEELRIRFKGKCAFCESKMEHVSNPQVEHYRPKSRHAFERFMFQWSNWLLSCGRCNQKKWAHFPACRGLPCLLNPTKEEPTEHIDFKRANILALSKRGQKTIRLVGLDRAPLNGARASWLTYIDSLLLLAALARQRNIKAESRNLLIWSMQNDAPYSAMTLAYLASRCPNLARPARPHPRIFEANQQERIMQLVKENADEISQIR